jgi:hypothetical protein
MSTPDRLVELLAEVALEHSYQADASNQTLRRATASRLALRFAAPLVSVELAQEKAPLEWCY